MVRGQCNCGAVAFEVNKDITDVFVCHCSICRKATGSSGIAVIVVDNDLFQWTRGKDRISTWKKPDGDWQTWFCPTCGSPLPGSNDEKRMFVPAGLITRGDENLKVAHHIYVDSKAVWDVIGDKGRQHAGPFQNEKE